MAAFVDEYSFAWIQISLTSLILRYKIQKNTLCQARLVTYLYVCRLILNKKK